MADISEIKKIIVMPNEENNGITVWLLRNGASPLLKNYADMNEAEVDLVDIMKAKYPDIANDTSLSEREIEDELINQSSIEGFYADPYDDTGSIAENIQEQLENEIAGEVARYPINLNPTENEEDDDLVMVHDGDDLGEDEDEDEEEYSNGTAKKVAVGVLAGAAVAGAAVGIAHLVNANVAKNSEKKTSTETDAELLINKLKDGTLAKEEYTKVYNFVENFNKLASQDGNFRLAADGSNYLEISAEEALYTSFVLNGYSADQITEILGTKQVSYDTIVKAYQSVCEKIKVYDMNAVIPSGLEALINDQTGKDLYASTEKEVINFNQKVNSGKVSLEDSDELMLTIKNNFVNNSVADSVNPAVAYIATQSVQGYMDANANNDQFLTYNSTIENAEGITNAEELSSVAKTIADKNYLANVQTSVKTAIDGHNASVTAKLSDERTALINALKKNGSNDLVSQIERGTDITSLEDKITALGGDISDLYDKYEKEVDSINPSGISADNIIEEINENATSVKTGDLKVLKENRVRKAIELEKEEEKEDTSSNTSSNEGVSSDYSSSDTSSAVGGGENSSSSDEEVTSDNEKFIEKENATYEDANEVANDFMNTPGAYKYDGEIKYDGMTRTQEELDSMTPYQLFKEMSMAGIDMPSSDDPQIQALLEGKDDSFKESFLNYYEEAKKAAYDDAQAEKESYDTMRQEAEVDANERTMVQNSTPDDQAYAVVVDDGETVVEDSNAVGDTAQAEDGAVAEVITEGNEEVVYDATETEGGATAEVVEDHSGELVTDNYDGTVYAADSYDTAATDVMNSYDATGSAYTKTM